MNNIISMKIASTIVATYYEMLKKLSSQDLEETEEYYEIINKIKNAINAENNISKNLTDKDYEKLINYFKKNEINNTSESRLYVKVRNYERLKDKTAIVINDDILLSSIITTKLLIDVLKLVSQKINSLDTDKEILKMYNNIIKYTYLTSNNFIEQVALNYNYNIEDIPEVDFRKIEESSGVKFIDLAQDLFIEYITSSITELNNIDESDAYLVKYSKIFGLSRIEIMLPYLNKTNILRIKELCDTKYNNDTIAEVKILIKQKEKDFNI